MSRAKLTDDRFRTLFDHAPLGIVVADAQGFYLDANPEACEALGYTHEELVGLHSSDVVTPEEVPQISSTLLDIHRRTPHRRDWRFRRKDGTTFSADVIATTLPDGTILGIIRDVTSTRAREQELARLSDLYAARSEVNQAIVQVPTRDELFARVCRVLVEHGPFKMSWIGWYDASTGRFVPVAAAGDHDGYLDTVAVAAADGVDGGGPSGVARRLGEQSVCNDTLGSASMQRWHEALARSRFRSSAAFPIRAGGVPVATLTVYAAELGFFQAREVALLEGVAADLSFALDNYAREEIRRHAERRLQSEKQFTDTMIESMPGIVYFYDADGRFLRWNRNFEAATGYSRAEVARMRPREFFPEADWPLLKARIAEVFANGESSVESSLLARDGSVIPCYFTGRRVLFEGQPCLVGVGIDISDRRRAEVLLVESERKYRELVEHANSIILRWTADGRITFLNEFGQRFFGYTASEIVGQRVTDTIVPPTESGGRNLQRLIDEICAGPEDYEENLNENVRRDGTRVWVAWTNRIILDVNGAIAEFLSIGTDVTERRREQARLRRSEAHLRDAQRIAGIGSWEWDTRRQTLTWSDHVYELFGVGRPDANATRQGYLQMVHPLDRDRLQAAEQAALSGRARLDIEHRIILPDGRERVVRVVADLKRDEGGQTAGLAGIVHDVTDRVRLEVERARRHQAEAADRIKSAFLATMSHELRTPLNSIIGFSGILSQGLAGPLNTEQRKQLGMVRSSARHLLALVNDVLDISKIEAGQLEIGFAPFDLDLSIGKACNLMTPQAEAKGLAFRTTCQAPLGKAVGDVRRFEQILLNLLTNAIKFTDRGEVGLMASIVEVGLPGAATPAPAVRVQVTDTGIGIRPEHLSNLFQPFRQIDSGLDRMHEGTGLGLAICRRLAHLMGGEIEAESVWEAGSTFIVTLPLTGRRGAPSAMRRPTSPGELPS